jgi:HlyD family secretion protein
MNVSRKHQYRWIVGLVILAMWCSGCQATAGSPLSNVVKAKAEGALTASGTIRATEVRVAADLGGRLLAVRTKEGMEVHAGDVLAVLDTTTWSTQLASAEAVVDTAQADLAVVKAGPRAEEIAAARAALALAEAQRDGALQAWKDAQAEAKNPQELDAQITTARTQLSMVAQAVDIAQAQLAREEILLGQKPKTDRPVTDQQLKAAQETLAIAQADQKTAQASLDQLLSIRNKPLALIAQANMAEGQYQIALAGVAVAQAHLDDLLAGSTPEQVAVAEATVRKAKAEANVLQVQVDKCTLTSPINGVVLNQVLKPGELAAPATPILTLADLSTVTLDVYVPENRIGQVRLGQSVRVTVDSFPGKTFDGHVYRIGDKPEFTPRNVATAEERLNTFYVAEIQLPNPDGLLKAGMPADARFGD